MAKPVRRIFISYQHKDQMKAKGFHLLRWNSNVDIDFVGRHLLDPVKSENEKYIKDKIAEQIKNTSVTVVLIGQDTKKSEFQPWEIERSLAKDTPNGILGIRLDKSVELPRDSGVGKLLHDAGAEIIDWNPDEFGDAIERAALGAGRALQITRRRQMYQVKNKMYVLEHIDIEVTHACNLDCMHCSASANAGAKGRILDNRGIERILTAATHVGLKKVGLTGGEPFMDPERLSWVAHLCRDHIGVPLHIHTNGTLIMQDMTKPSGLLTLFEAISITFLGGNAQAHDEVTRKKGAFQDALRGVRIIVDAGLPLTCFFVPTRDKCDSFGPLIQELASIGVTRIRALALAPSGRARPIYSGFAPAATEIPALEADLQDAMHDHGLCVEAGYCTRLSFPRLAVLSGHERCTSGLNRLHINSEGDVFPCTAASGVEELRIGNLRGPETHVDVLWRESPKLNTIRASHSGTLKACETCGQEPKCRYGCMVNACGTMSRNSCKSCPVVTQA
jgi:radical SAM protein with 4Fe4S-binding SPASM domain